MVLSHRRIAASVLGLALGRCAAEAGCGFDGCQADVDDAALLQKAKTHSLTQHQARQEPDVVKLLKGFVTGPDGKPNPRVTCTPGNKAGRVYIAEQLQAVGATPLGDNGGYEQLLPGTDTVEGCEDGIANVIGFLKGAQHTDEYVVVSAHIDGPNNQGEYQNQIGNEDTDDAYDDGSGVAAALTMAKEFAANPPDYSIIFFFTAAEEGFQNIGVGATNPVAQKICDVTQPLWTAYNNPNVYCRDSQGEMNNFPVGSTYFALKPTFAISKVRAFMSMDPLGAPGLGGSPLLAIIGSENFPGLRDIVQSGFDEHRGLLRPTYVTRQSVSTNYGDMDPFVREGVPSFWAVQPGFQSYHGGMEYSSLEGIFEYFKMNPEMFWALDRSCSLNVDMLTKAVTVLTSVVRKLASDSNSRPTVDPRPTNPEYPNNKLYAVPDGQDAVNNYQFLVDGLAKGSEVTGISAEDSQQVSAIASQLMAKVQGCIDSSPDGWMLPMECQDSDSPLPGPVGLATALTMAVDFLSSRLGEQAVVHAGPPSSIPMKCPLPPSSQ